MGKGLIICAFFILSLFFSSLAVSFLAESKYGDTSVPTFKLPNSLESYYGAQDYQAGDYNSSISEIRGLFSEWQYQPNVGMVHTVNGVFDTNYFLINNIQLDSNKRVKNHYIINNSVKQDFKIVLRYTNIGGKSEIVVKQDGFHVPDYTLFDISFSDLMFIPYPNANQYETVIIDTEYFDGDKDNTPSGTFVFNGESFDLTNLPLRGNAYGVMYTDKYGGVSSSTIGTTFVSFNSENRIGSPTDNPLLTGLDRVASFITFIFTMLIFSLPEHILPTYLQLLLIAPQEFMILLGLVMSIKGE